MPHFMILGRDGPEGLALRPQHRPAHLENLKPFADAGRVIHAGPILDEDGSPRGSLIVLEAESLEAAKAIATSDPYVVNGIFDSVEVIETKVVFPEPAD